MYVEQPNNLKPATFTNATHFLTHSERVRIKNMHKTVEKWEGKVHDKDNSKKANSVRQVDVYPIQDLGLAELIYDTVKSHNATSFRFDIAGIFDNLQLLHYKTGHHYDWHTDTSSTMPTEGITANTIRKISCVIQLSDAKDYEGGDFNLVSVDTEKEGEAKTWQVRPVDIPHMKQKGAAIFFPSTLFHRVRPITNGTRRTLVTWFRGPKWI